MFLLFELNLLKLIFLGQFGSSLRTKNELEKKRKLLYSQSNIFGDLKLLNQSDKNDMEAYRDIVDKFSIADLEQYSKLDAKMKLTILETLHTEQKERIMVCAILCLISSSNLILDDFFQV